MKTAIVYSSKSGNTRSVAEIIKNKIGKTEYFGAPSNDALISELIFVGFWTDKGKCSKETEEFLHNLHGKTVALFGTAGFGGDKLYFNRILSGVKAEIPSDNEILEGFMCQGRMPLTVRERYEKMLQKDPGNIRLAALIKNFDNALAHPDKNDFEDACKWAESIVQTSSN